ncbi:Exopolyphosphatase, partial [hydrothermal vent metagenome]
MTDSGQKTDMASVAVLDIGSNSVRLVIYEHLGRTLTPLFNEKTNCTLGRGVAKDKKIAPENASKALKAIARFGLVVKMMEVKAVYVIATSAVREASNGKKFMAGVELLMQVKGRILSGAQEAHYAARGIIFGMPDFAGLVGDLGGGSLELSIVGAKKDFDGETHELGVIRLEDDSGFSIPTAIKITKNLLEKSTVLNKSRHETFCAIGGTWRAFAQLMQVRSNYPLHMVQNYQVSAADALNLAHELIKYNGEVAGIETVSRSRRPLLVYGAVVMAAVLEKGNFKNIVFSSHGVREGYLFDRLPAKEAKKDPLIVASEEICYLRARSVVHANELVEFTQSFMKETGEKESSSQRRLRHAACLL